MILGFPHKHGAYILPFDQRCHFGPNSKLNSDKKVNFGRNECFRLSGKKIMKLLLYHLLREQIHFKSF